jgi:hypothetical protein
MAVELSLRTLTGYRRSISSKPFNVSAQNERRERRNPLKSILSSHPFLTGAFRREPRLTANDELQFFRCN